MKSFSISVSFAWLGIILSSTLCPTTGHAVLLAADNFVIGPGDYTATNLNLQTSASATGFPAAWGGAQTGWIQINNGNLNMPGVENANGRLLLTPNSDGHYSRLKNHGYTAAASGLNQLWFSTLYMPSDRAFDPGREVMMGFLSGSPPISGAGTGLEPLVPAHATEATWRTGNGGSFAGFGFGIDTMLDSSAYLSVKYQQDHGGSAAVISTKTNIALNINTTYFLLARLDVNTSGTTDVLNIWALSSLPTSEAALGAPMWSVSANILTNSSNLNMLNLWTGSMDDRPVNGGVGATTSLSYFDALKIGTSFYDVAPEPGRSMLLMIAIIGVTMRRRRRCGYEANA